MIWVWIGFLLFVGAMLALEIALGERRARRVRSIDSLVSAGFWIGVSLAANAGVFYLYHADPFGVGKSLTGQEATQQFLATFVVECTLSLDNVVVIAALMAFFKIPREMQLRVLFAGAIISVALRGLMIAGGTALLNNWQWTSYFFGVLLLLSALRMILVRQENMNPDKNLFVLAIRRLFGGVHSTDGRRFFTTVDGKTVPTILFIALVMIETADGVFAFDSIPAGLALTKEPFILFASNVLAVLTVRSLVLVLTRFVGWLRYFKVALTLMLLFLAAKMFFPGWMIDLHPEISLAVIFSIVTAGGVASILGSRPDPTLLTARPSPLGEDAERVARVTLKQARKVMVLLVGTAVVIAGVAMMIGPGPGLVVVPIGLAILATEFIWAKRLLDRYAQYATTLGKKAGGEVMKRTRLWHVPVVIVGTLTFWIAVRMYTDFRLSTILMGALPMLIGQAVWAFMLVRARRQARANGHPRGASGVPDAPPPNQAGETAGGGPRSDAA